MTQIDNGILIGIFSAIIGVYILFSKFLMSRKNGNVTKAEFAEHKKTVQYKDNCEETVKRMEVSISAVANVQNEKFKNIEAGLARIEAHVRK